ncbi:hypothetical protein SAMN05428997_13626 [Bosea sp. CRIB-10]|nr:hypothetical protein SAMN05428997_13626 [Bosea sp. CRIB-10]
MPVTNCFSSRFAALPCVALPTGSGCVRGIGTGQVVDRVVEKGELQGFTFNEPPYDDSYINLPAAYDIRDRAAYARLQAAFDDLFRKGTRLKIRSVACGAAGRIVKLVSATLIGAPPAPGVAAVPAPAPTPPISAPAAPAAPPAAPPPAPAAAEPMDALLRSPDSPAKPAIAPKVDEPPAPAATQAKPAAEPPAGAAADVPKTATATPPAAPRKPSRWRLTQRRRSRSISKSSRTIALSAFLSAAVRTPGGAWRSATGSCPRATGRYRNRRRRPRSTGARSAGKSMAPTKVSSSVIPLEAAAAFRRCQRRRTELARGQRLVVNGRMDRGGRARDAVFDISGGDEAFASLEARCRALRG